MRRAATPLCQQPGKMSPNWFTCGRAFSESPEHAGRRLALALACFERVMGVKHAECCIPPPRGARATSASPLSSCLAAASVCCVLKECPKYLVYTTRMRWRDNAETRVCCCQLFLLKTNFPLRSLVYRQIKRTARLILHIAGWRLTKTNTVSR